jgi:hypothetical protein
MRSKSVVKTRAFKEAAMSKFLSRMLSPSEIEALVHDVLEAARTGHKNIAWDKVQPLRQAQHHQRDAAKALLHIICQDSLPVEGAIDVVSEVAKSHEQDFEIVAQLGECLEAVRDIDDLNAAPPAAAVFYSIVDSLAALAKDHEGRPTEEAILRGLSTASRMLGRQRDSLAEQCYRKLAEIKPLQSHHHYNLGLFFKTRGKFKDGVKSNQTAARLSAKEVDSHQWNLGICATGAGQGDLALSVWKRMGQKIEMGRFGLPEGSYPSCKVKLAERPLAERGAETDDPGLEETIWIERLSPCHGIIRSVLYANLGVNYGDVILIDGAPITYHTYGDDKIPVFPQLATLLRRNYQIFDFAGTQDEARQLAKLSTELDEDIVVYPHSEALRWLCASCWKDTELQHEKHQSTEKNVVIGRIAAPPQIDPAKLLDQIDRAVAKHGHCQVYAPVLSAAAGHGPRARVDQRRFDLLTNN